MQSKSCRVKSECDFSVSCRQEEETAAKKANWFLSISFLTSKNNYIQPSRSLVKTQSFSFFLCPQNSQQSDCHMAHFLDTTTIETIRTQLSFSLLNTVLNSFYCHLLLLGTKLSTVKQTIMRVNTRLQEAGFFSVALKLFFAAGTNDVQSYKQDTI